MRERDRERKFVREKSGPEKQKKKVNKDKIE